MTITLSESVKLGRYGKLVYKIKRGFILDRCSKKLNKEKLTLC